MRAAGLVGCHRRRRARAAVADPAHTPAPNLVARDFAAPAPDRLWIGDVTYLPTREGWLYLAVLLDAHSRHIVGWAMADHLRAETRARRARDGPPRPPPGLVHHTDRGCRYTAAASQDVFAARGVTVSMSRSGECLDNAMAESFLATHKAVIANEQVRPRRAAARTAIFAWIEVLYNRQRRHSALTRQPPVTSEEEWLVSSQPAAER